MIFIFWWRVHGVCRLVVMSDIFLIGENVVFVDWWRIMVSADWWRMCVAYCLMPHTWNIFVVLCQMGDVCCLMLNVWWRVWWQRLGVWCLMTDARCLLTDDECVAIFFRWRNVHCPMADMRSFLSWRMFSVCCLKTQWWPLQSDDECVVFADWRCVLYVVRCLLPDVRCVVFESWCQMCGFCCLMRVCGACWP